MACHEPQCGMVAAKGALVSEQRNNTVPHIVTAVPAVLRAQCQITSTANTGARLRGMQSKQ
jgi:hypothetical protein